MIIKFLFKIEIFYLHKNLRRWYKIVIKIKKRYQGRVREFNRDIINERIQAREMLVIDSKGNKLGILSRQVALKKAEEQELDLVLIAPKANPPVAKIIDYGKYKYEKKKREQDSKKKQKIIEQKEIRITPNIGQHDLDVKIKNAQKFLEKGKKVKLSLSFRGREMANKEVGFLTMQRAIDALSSIAEIEKKPQLNGRFYDAYLAPKIKKGI